MIRCRVISNNFYIKRRIKINKQARRCQKAIDELIKIQKDSPSSMWVIAGILDKLWSLQNQFDKKDEKDE